MYKTMHAVLRFKAGTPFAGSYIYKLTSDKGYQVTPRLEAAMLFASKTAAESYLRCAKYAYFANTLEAITVEL